MQHFLSVAVAACLCSVSRAGFPWVEQTYGEPWPAPESLQLSDTSLLVALPDRLEFHLIGEQCTDLWQAVTRYQEVVTILAEARASRQTAANAPQLRDGVQLERIDINLTSSCQGRLVPHSDMDESYRIDVGEAAFTSGLATLTANSLWGALRGLETLVQLMYNDGESGLCIREATVIDRPRYSYRGILLDTARHFIPVYAIKDMLEVMAINKFNVFHWHVVDDQSFPFVSVKFPALSEASAYAEDLVYSTQDVEDIIEFARLRGIRVIPEFDTPGHTLSWGYALPGFTAACYGADGQPDGTFGPVDPSNEDVYIMMSIFLEEVAERFLDKYIHLGGDEVSFGFDCWLSNPQITAWMQQLGITTPEEVESVYIQRLLDVVGNLTSQPEYVIWQEVIDSGIKVKPNTIVEVWKGNWENEMATVTGKGLRAILSSPWYLDYIGYGSDWYNYYDVEPESFGGSDEQNALVMGGEACLWSEFVDENNMMPRLWPRASATGERLWSPKDTTRSDYTARRMEEHRCRITKRGFRAEPANGPGFC